MKSRKKIWTIPIAVLALALMLAGALAVSGIVLAQSSGNKTFTIGTDNYFERTYTRIYGTGAGALTDGATVATFGLAADSADAVAAEPGTTGTPAVVGLDEGDDDQGISGYQVNSDLFQISDMGAFTVSADAAEKLNDPDRPNVFTFNVNIFVDTNTEEDGDTTKTLSEEETANEGARDGFVEGDGVDDDSNDLDEVNTITVVVRVLKAADADFAAIPGMASVNDILYGTEGESQDVAITGLTSDMTVREVTEDNAAIYGENGAGDLVSLKYTDPENADITVTDGARSRDVTVLFTVNVDTDKDNADGIGDGNAENAAGDPVANDDEDDRLVIFTASITVYNVLKYVSEPETPSEATPLRADGSSDNPYTSSIRSSATEGTQADVINIDGSASAEDVDVIVRGGGPFTASPRKTGEGEAAAYTQVVIMASRDLTIADEGMHNIVITINGRALPTRTAQAYARIRITASNPAPTSGYDADNPLVVEIAETDDELGNLIDADDDLKTDLADYVTDDSDASGLRYTVVGSTVFDTDGSKLIVTGDVSDSEQKPGTGAEEDDEDTINVDETVTVYVRDDGGKFGADGTKAETTDEFGDITYKFSVKVQDAANSLTIPVVVKLNVNEPVMQVTDSLPAGITYDAEHKVLVDDDDDEETDLVEVTMPTYFVTAPYSDRDVPVTLFNFGQLASDSDSGDDLDAEVAGNPPHIVHDGTTNNVILTYMPPNAETGIVSVVTVGVNDGFNPPEADEDDNVADDVNLRIEITVTEIPPEPITSNFVSITVAENSTDCSQTGVASGCSVAGVVTGGETYSIESGVDGGDTNYEIDASTGAITVKVAPDFEDGKSPAFLVNVQNSDGDLAGLISIRVSITDVDEAPIITEMPTGDVAWVYENFQINDAVVTKVSTQATPDVDNDPDTVVVATDPEGMALTYSIENKVPFSIDADGTLRVSGVLEADDVAAGTQKTHEVNVKVEDPAGNSSMTTVTVTVLNSNETPRFTSPTGDAAVTTIPENTGNAHVIFTFTAVDEDGDDLEFNLREGQSRDLFVIESATSEIVDGEEVWSGELHVKMGVTLDFEDAGYDPRVHVEANDPEGLNATLLLTVNLSNVNDNAPKFNVAPATSLSVTENTARGVVLANYAATDADGETVRYSLGGDDAKRFTISATGDLMTLESLDADLQVPCGSAGCDVTIIASDGTHHAPASTTDNLPPSVRISVTAIEDSVSTLDVTKANPVPGTEMGNPMSALAGVKTGGDEYLWNLLDCPGMLDLVDASDDEANRGKYCKMWDGLKADAKDDVSKAFRAAGSKAPQESPYSLPASDGSGPENFVETEWANWGTILRIEVTAESPSATCGDSDNRCVVVKIESDSAGTDIWLEAYRSGSQENKFVAALMLVERSEETASASATEAVYAHSGGGVARLKVDEEDEIEIEFGNLRGSIEIENEDPEISNFAPEHEAAFDDPDVDYTFRVMDDNSGLPEAEDLPDVDGDDAYTPVVALISKGGQCETVDNVTSTGKARIVELEKNGYEDVEDTEGMLDGKSLYCPGDEQDGEFDAKGTGYGFAPIRDDRDFDKVDDGYDVKTTIVLDENKTYYVTFIACDNAGNCTFYDPDGNDDAVELAEITVDIYEPDFVEARTGLTWDSTDNEYDDNKSFIQVIFNDLTNLNVATVEIDDFVVEGHTVKDVHIFENPDDDDVDWGGGPNERYASPGNKNLREIDRYRDLENAVFVELEDELLADETPDVAIVPNGVEDKAGNEQDDGDNEADDWISPTFTIVSMVSTLETSQSEVLAGDDDEVTVVVTSDERLDSTRPTVTVTYVNAPAGTIDTKGIATCDDKGDNDGTRDRGEIVLDKDDPCGGSRAAGGTLNNSVEKVSNTEWIVTITEPKATGYYNFRIEGKDRSPQNNDGSEGIAAKAIVSDFFDADGDVNADDAIFFEGDINLPKPEVRVSGVSVEDNEADVEFRSPLFVELNFAMDHSDPCGNVDTDERMANCENENSEYAEDNFDDVVVTSFVLDGVDITDSVKTTDNQSFLVSLESISIGDHTATVQAVDQAGNVFEDTLEIDFEVNDRDPFEKRLSPGWNLVSLPGEPADSSIAAVFGPGVEVRTVYSYDPVIPGGWQVAVRETLDSDWQGDLTEITGQHGYWVLSDAIQDWEVSIPRLAGGSAGTGTPIQPPVIPMYAGWNLIPVTDVSGNALSADIRISAEVYLNSLDDGLDLARVLGYNTIKNEWFTVLDMQIGSPGDLRIGSGYWVFVREAAALVPGGIAGVSGGD